MKSIFSKNLKKRREEIDLTTKKLGDITGISQPVISKFENGQEPKVSTILLLCDALKCTPNDLLLDEYVGRSYLVMEDGEKYGINEAERLKKINMELKEKILRLEGKLEAKEETLNHIIKELKKT